MTDRDPRRTYFDHEPVYRKIAAEGGRGWYLCHDSFTEIERFLGSPFAPPAGTRALEPGCGGGQASLLLAKAGYRVLGMDFSETAIELARGNAAEIGAAAEFRVGDCIRLPSLPDASFGLVADNHFLHCVVGDEDRAAFFATVARLLEPGGVLFSDTMSSEGGFDPAAMSADPATRIALSGTRYWVSEAELDRELAAAGLRVVFRERRAPSDEDPPGCGDTIVTYAQR